jgi:putative hydrolase of the HAD superfamily
MMSQWCGSEEAIEALLNTEKANIPLLGYGSKPFIISLVECGIALSNGTISTRQISALIELGKNTIGKEIQLYPGAEEVLNQLKENYPLILATKGDLKEQESKVERSGLKKYFNHIEIMSEKNLDAYNSILQRIGISPEHFVMVGNSFKSDIQPVLDLGGTAIYIPSEIIWAHEITEVTEHPNLIKASTIKDVPSLLN